MTPFQRNPASLEHAPLPPPQPEPAVERIDEAFQCAPIPILIEDWSGIKRWVDTLRASGVRDLDAYLDEHPEVIEELRALHGFVDANESTLALFGLASKEEFFAHARSLLPANRPSNSQVLRAMFQGKTACQGERTLMSRSGRAIPIVWRCSLPADSERYRRLHFYAFDVTEYKENDERLQALRSEMARTARISLAGQLASSITHEISQPISATLTSLDAALQWLGRATPDIGEAIEAIGNAARWTRDTGEICRNLRGFLARHPVRPALISAADVVESAIFLIASEAAARQVSITKAVHADVTVFVDRIQLQQVLGNLLLNGIHAIQGAPDNDRRTITVTVSRYQDNAVLFEVADTGHGIDASVAASLFQPFFSSKPDGMGLGLSISRSIVEAHGGNIWVASTSASGTRFCFTLPASGAPTASVRSLPEMAAMTRRRLV
ncbi:histidine kinase [Cupriavidus sp. HPC(L)]|uniref:sensor histidine kinase n=1 Tax=Cupriavidus sp. HPC(L) TaxID=1217418 RepID=UPI000290D6C3|nr:ATP-binding protein [Cupriavidus sp. HPC(L)]ESJ21490.1 histidine kinase [Cupriavidus sp. HPC(L)]